MNAYETIRCAEVFAGVLRVSLNRPGKHNAIDATMIRELTDISQDLSVGGKYRAVILAAEGSTFCAGADLGWMKEQFTATPEKRAVQAQALFRMFRALDELPQMVIGVVQGPAYGGGLGLAAICDIVIASEDARFMLSETRLGLIPATVAPFLQRRIGPAGLRRFGLHGELIAAAQAQAMGLVSELVAKEALTAAAERHIAGVLASAPGAVAAAKALFRALGRGEVSEQSVTQALSDRWRSEEAQAGITAFFAKKVPPWQE